MRLESDFFCFDNDNRLCIPSLKLTLERGEAVAILGVRGNDIYDIYDTFNSVNPLSRKSNPRPVIRCVSRSLNLFPHFSALENFSMAERSVIRYNKKQIVKICNDIKREFGISIDFHVPLRRLPISEQIIVQLIRAYISEMDILVCDNLISMLSIEDRRILFSIFQAMKAAGKSIIYLTTKWENAIQVASRILVTDGREAIGEMSTREVIENPQDLLFLISGRTLMEQNAESADSSKILDMLYSGAEYLTNNYELKETLSVVINNVSRIIHCDYCTISLRNHDSKYVHTYLGNYMTAPILDKDFISEYLNGDHPESVIYMSTEDINFDKIVSAPSHDVKSFIALPIINKNHILGLLTVFFSNVIIYDDQQFHYLKSFCREVSVVAETSRLINNSILLQESNHRIKNNLQIITSLIAMQQLYIQQHPETDVDQILDSISNCVQNIAYLHDLLTSPTSNSNNIDLHRIIESILRLYETSKVAITVDADDLLVPYAKATSISIVINELIANCVRHAFHKKPCPSPRILVSCHIIDEIIILKVQDNGSGLPETVDVGTSQSIGFAILRAIVNNELHGSLQIENTGNGTLAAITIPYVSLITDAYP